MKIKLTKKEIEILERHSKCRICCPTKEAMKIIGPLLNKALDYKEKIGSKDTPDSMLLWYYGQYKAQQKQKGVLPTREK